MIVLGDSVMKVVHKNCINGFLKNAALLVLLFSRKISKQHSHLFEERS